jgi:hypothetical protein
MSLGVTEALCGVSWMKLASSTPRASTHWLLAWSWLLLQGTRTTASTTQLNRPADKAALLRRAVFHGTRGGVLDVADRAAVRRDPPGQIVQSDGREVAGDAAVVRGGGAAQAGRRVPDAAPQGAMPSVLGSCGVVPAKARPTATRSARLCASLLSAPRATAARTGMGALVGAYRYVCGGTLERFR